MAKPDNVKKEVSEAVKPADERTSDREEIEKLKFNVEKLSEELNTAVAELKKSIIDIRSAVSEIENPFNLLRVISSEKDLKRINSERLPPGVKSLFLGKPEEKREEKEEEQVPPEPLAEQVPKAETVEAEESKVELRPELEERQPFVVRLPPGTAYLDWVWSLLDVGFTPDDVKQLQSYERLGFLPQGCSEQLYSLAVAAEKAKSKGLTKTKLLLNMYKASVISGVQISVEDLKRLIAMAEGRVDKAKMAKRVE